MVNHDSFRRSGGIRKGELFGLALFYSILHGYSSIFASLIAILRYRLWDINIFIHHALIHESLVAILALR